VRLLHRVGQRRPHRGPLPTVRKKTCLGSKLCFIKIRYFFKWHKILLYCYVLPKIDHNTINAKLLSKLLRWKLSKVWSLHTKTPGIDFMTLSTQKKFCWLMVKLYNLYTYWKIHF
jgi:hypothetical protein